MSTNEIFELISLIFSILLPLIGFISALIKVIKEKQWNILKSELCSFMIKAEEMVGASGEEKKNAVLQWAKDFCEREGISFNVDQVSSAIETLINLTKNVNSYNNKDTKTTE